MRSHINIIVITKRCVLALKKLRLILFIIYTESNENTPESLFDEQDKKIEKTHN